MKKIIDTLKTAVTDTTGMLSESYDDAVNLLKDTLSNFYDVKDITKEKVTTLTNDLIALAPIIEKTGFRSKEINVGISVPPKIIFHFEKIADVSKEEITKVLEENGDKTMLKVIVNLLVTADEF